MTAEEKPTTPVAPKTASFRSFKLRLFLSFNTFSTHATIAAAVVNEPAGSAKNEMPNGGTSAFLAFSSMSSAAIAFLPAMNIAVRAPTFGGREKIASCTRPVISSSVTLDEIPGLVQDAIFSRPPKVGARTAMFIAGKNAIAALDMLEKARKALVPPFGISFFADPAGSFTTAAAMVACVEKVLKDRK